MANAKITMPGGVSIDVDGTAEEITAVLENLRKTSVASAPAGRTGTSIPKGRGEISRLIETLKSEDFFRAPRGLGEIQKKFAEIGHHYPLTTLSGAMISQSRMRARSKGGLRRFKQDGKYVYVQ
jgi:hypothetical protein